jgi:hypothetical protein
MAITANMVKQFQKPSIDLAPIKQTPFADYWAGEHAVTNDPNLGPWTPEQYEQNKNTTKSEWLKTHPEDWQPEDLFTSSWAGKLIENLKQELAPIAQAENPAWELAKGVPGAMASIPGNLVEQFKNPVRYYGEHPEASITDLLMLLGIGGAKGKGMAPAGGRALGGSTVEGTVSKLLSDVSSAKPYSNKPGRYTPYKRQYAGIGFSDEPKFTSVSQSEKWADVSPEQAASMSAKQLPSGGPYRMEPAGTYSGPSQLPKSYEGGATVPPRMYDLNKEFFNPDAQSLDAALKEVDNILGGTKTAYISKEARMQKLLKQIYELMGKNK